MLLFGYENIDLDRLERASFYDMYPRGQGRTFKFMMHMLSCAHVCEHGSRYLYIGENRYFADDMMRSLATVLEREGFEIDVKPRRHYIRVLAPTDILFDFISPAQVFSYNHGQPWTDIFEDLTDQRRNRYNRELHELSYRIY